MYRFIESIRMIDGEAAALPYHQKRVDRTLQSLGHGTARLPLAEIVGTMSGTYFGKSLCGQACKERKIYKEGKVLKTEKIHKARIVYNIKGEILEAAIMPYTMRKINSIRLVKCDNIDYSLKYADRSGLDALSELADGADEIIIVRHGMLTDTSYSNIALLNGDKWVTPRTPLLKGTMRQQLLDKNLLIEADITPEALKDYQQICLINAMMPLGSCCIDTTKVFY